MTVSRLVLLAGLALAAASPARATGEIESLITDADRARLDAFDATREKALAEARGGAAADVAILDAVTGAPALPLDGFDPLGDWKCRTIKAGGLATLVVYGWFDCRITDDGAGWTLEKLSGSQRTTGRFFTDGDLRNVYLGGFFVAGDAAPRYGAGPESDQVGYMVRTGEDAFRIEFPAPRYESLFDVLEFRR